jgi:hypothetical protein
MSAIDLQRKIFAEYIRETATDYEIGELLDFDEQLTLLSAKIKQVRNERDLLINDIKNRWIEKKGAKQ